SFPALVALGLPPVVANATNTVALVPGSLAAAWAYRHELATHRWLVWRFLTPSIIGGLVGAVLVLAAPAQVFEMIVPWLVLGATLLVAFKSNIRDAIQRAHPSTAESATGRHRTASLAILAMAVYGGYFGAGIGMITLAVLALVTALDIHEMNAVKALIASTVNGAAAALFLCRGTPHLPTASLMALGVMSGGYVGAKLARRTNAKVVERIIVAIGIAMTLLLLWRWLSQSN
ncbi:MAG TPA: sulfite exporter TauE/SafE family protein, partial [Polyangiaceae bacterium]